MIETIGNFAIKVDDLSDGEVIKLLEEHLADMYAISPPESVHALDVEALRSPNIKLFSAWICGELEGCLAIKRLSSSHSELKSMRTVAASRNNGVGSILLLYALNTAFDEGYRRASLETGTQAFFEPARKLYEKFGFRHCEPFSNYQLDPNSVFMTRELITRLI